MRLFAFWRPQKKLRGVWMMRTTDSSWVWKKPQLDNRELVSQRTCPSREKYRHSRRDRALKTRTHSSREHVVSTPYDTSIQSCLVVWIRKQEPPKPLRSHQKPRTGKNQNKQNKRPTESASGRPSIQHYNKAPPLTRQDPNMPTSSSFRTAFRDSLVNTGLTSGLKLPIGSDRRRNKNGSNIDYSMHKYKPHK